MSALCSTSCLLEDITIVQMVAPCRPAYRPRISAWHRVLDDLSWLCDDLPAGQSVTSVAAHGTENITFYIATNDHDGKLACQHLRSVIQCLSTVFLVGEARTKETILQLCLKRSSEKIAVYVQQLMRTLCQARLLVSTRQPDVFADPPTPCLNY